MRKFIACILLFLFSQSIFAQQSCSLLEKKITIFFANGILTSSESAWSSSQKLRKALGDDFNGIRLGYDIAQNETNGATFDLIQSLLQADLQWSSQVAGWLNNLGVIPDWFYQWRQKAALGMTMILAPELEEHVLKYHDELVMGHGVLVVSHSQGNFYANEARPLLKRISTDGQMEAFTIFGVATPANNVGGGGGPYYTNHRDFIQHILPDTLPENWKLRYLTADRSLADDVSVVNAHFFNDTYLSDKFDVKAELVRGFKTSLAALRLPQQQACANYRSLISDQVQGTFVGQLSGYDRAASISFNAGVINLPDGAISFTHPDDGVRISHTLEGSNVISTSRGIVFTGENGGRGKDYKLTSYWESSGQFALLETPHAWWQRTDKVPTTGLTHPIDVVSVAANEMQGYRGVFPPGTCKTFPDLKAGPQAYTVNDQYVPISVSGAVVTVGDQSYSLRSNLKSEGMSVVPFFISPGVVDGEAQFWFDAGFTDGTSLMLRYKQFKGMVELTFTSPPKAFICQADWYKY
jgi:hypothetical protein